MLTADWRHVSGCQENLARSTISCSLCTALVLDVIFDLETSSSVVRNLSANVLPSRLFPVHPLLFETLNTISVCQLTVLTLSVTLQTQGRLKTRQSKTARVVDGGESNSNSFTELHCALAAVQCIVIGPVCGFVGGWVC